MKETLNVVKTYRKAILYFLSKINSNVSLPKVENVVYAPQKLTPNKAQIEAVIWPFTCR